ncbi:MAG: aminotransferase class IV [Lentimicrobium sp.]
MPEYTRDFFFANCKLLPAEQFLEYFTPQLQYVYEVFRVIDGIPLFLEDHLERFFQTSLLAGVDAAFSKESLHSDIKRLISANNGGEGNIKLSIVPGISGKQNLLIYFTPHQYPTPGQFEKGVSVKLLAAERDNPNAKVMDVPLRAATDQIKQNDEVYEVLLVDHQGFITEGSRSNVFFIRGDEVITPPVEMVLPGVTRKHLISLCHENGIRVNEQPVHKNNLHFFDALFISGTSRKVLPVNMVDERIFKVDNDVILRISGLFTHHVELYISAHR